jgi:hypothetical protein
MAKKNSTDAESSAYRDTAFELAVKNKEKREIIVNSDKPYLCPKCGIAKHPSEFGKQYMKNYIV